ncbi:inositol monophosphatase [Roseibium sp. TrichSKD4]|nr:inositol monophosphatase [Roseibium sp. TrichSKD4]
MRVSEELAEIVQEAPREFVLPSFRILPSEEISTKSNRFDLVTQVV